ncbi:hypothetical protein KR50_13090 [Jeotgalibacillus campisalis]|uniref:Uncharacterized protein n=1 Tax=Jeotgalibacillus campisalis TaxID=220754 RepID=A0A0C2S3Z9_9BACL|nr:hypothetical protein KR50_13090 [Jeotgalibacillus campisalis]
MTWCNKWYNSLNSIRNNNQPVQEEVLLGQADYFISSLY